MRAFWRLALVAAFALVVQVTQLGNAAAAVSCYDKTGKLVGAAPTKAGCLTVLASTAKAGNPVGNEELQAFFDIWIGADIVDVIGEFTTFGADTMQLQLKFKSGMSDTTLTNFFNQIAAEFGGDISMNDGAFTLYSLNTTKNPGYQPVPEPSTIFLLAAGFAGLAGMGYRRHRSANKN